MKKLYFSFISLLLFSWHSAKAQGTDTLLFENFENDPEAYILATFPSGDDQTWINYDLDQYNDASGANRPGEWYLSLGGFADVDSNTYVYMSNSWTTPPDPVANYLILPPMDIVDNTATLSWKSAPRQTHLYLDGYYVVISTSCNVDDCFPDTLFRAAEYISVDALEPDSGFSQYNFSPGFVHGADGTYIQYDNDSARFIGVLQPHTVSLTAYEGQTVYIAFVHGSKDDNLISVDDILVTGTKSTGIEEEVNKNSLNLYPNPSPANSSIILEWQMNKTSDVTLKIYDAAGGLVKTINCGVRIKGHHQIQINVADLIPGTYSIVLENGTGKTVSPLTIQ
jgi:hypothetical protein